MRPDHPSIQIPSDVLAYVGGVGIVLMMVHIVIDVLGREVVGTPLDGTTEIVSFYNMVAVTFLPLAFVAHHEGHILVELFTRGLGPRRLAGLEAAIGSGLPALVRLFLGEAWVRAG